MFACPRVMTDVTAFEPAFGCWGWRTHVCDAILSSDHALTRLIHSDSRVIAHNPDLSLFGIVVQTTSKTRAYLSPQIDSPIHGVKHFPNNRVSIFDKPDHQDHCSASDKRRERERGSKPVKWKVTKAGFAERELAEA